MPLPNKISIDLSAPTLKDFGLRDSIYDDIKAQEASFEKLLLGKKKAIKSNESSVGCSGILIFYSVMYLLAATFLVNSKEYPARLNFILISGFLTVLLVVTIAVLCYIKKRLVNEKEKLHSQFDILKTNNRKIVAPFENAYHKYYQEQMDNFYHSRLQWTLKKRQHWTKDKV
jgi:hypothetical protein